MAIDLTNIAALASQYAARNPRDILELAIRECAPTSRQYAA